MGRVRTCPLCACRACFKLYESFAAPSMQTWQFLLHKLHCVLTRNTHKWWLLCHNTTVSGNHASDLLNALFVAESHVTEKQNSKRPQKTSEQIYRLYGWRWRWWTMMMVWTPPYGRKWHLHLHLQLHRYHDIMKGGSEEANRFRIRFHVFKIIIFKMIQKENLIKSLTFKWLYWLVYWLEWNSQIIPFLLWFKTEQLI